MLAGYAMSLLALGALVMVLCTGFGDNPDDDSTERDTGEDADPPRAPRSRAHSMNLWFE